MGSLSQAVVDMAGTCCFGAGRQLAWRAAVAGKARRGCPGLNDPRDMEGGTC